MAITNLQQARQLYRFGGDTMGGPNDKSIDGPGPEDKSTMEQTMNTRAAILDSQKTKPSNVNNITNTVGDAMLLKNLINLNPLGIVKNIGSKILLDKVINQVNQEDEDTMLADGGRAGLAEGGMPYEGGIMDLESARQMYGLGKLVKKVTRSVKKIAKSPIGKIALIGGGLGLAGIGPLSGLAKTSFGTSLGNFFGRGSLNPLKALSIGKDVMQSPFGKFVSGLPGGGIGLGITAASAIAGALTPEQEEEAQKISDETGIDIETIRANPNQYLARRFRAEGGSMKEPVAKKTMPLLDMDGQEMDLRAEGGFVPIGRMEKADDVPARLSKNEFVFTADAVRNAGEGDVDKGAEVMYNMMKNLESGGDVSEESQGLEGARKMFQTSQRLEEVL
jgi:hypothetical protein